MSNNTREKLIVSYGTDDSIKTDFLNFPRILYDKEKCPQDIKTERQILNNKHVLSNDIKVTPFIVYGTRNSVKRVVTRCLVTYYKNDDNAYVGFFESIYNERACNMLFNKITEVVKRDRKKRLVGPINSSFWLGYRFKKSSDKYFNNTFTGEPYNLDYYTRLWEKSGFIVTDNYKSNFYRQVELDDKSEKCMKRLSDMKAKGYIIKNSSYKTFNKDLEDIYDMLIELYSSFPLYKSITFEQFKTMFGYLKYILNYSMVKLVYKENKAVAFVVCIPNYGDYTIGRMTFKKLINILRIRKNPKDYVIMYMGVKPEHLGLGSALAEDVKTELYNNKCTSIGALIHENKVSNSYYNKLIIGSTNYVIMEKAIQ